MKTLSSDITTQSTAKQGQWCELYDIYLKGNITSTYLLGGTGNILRITDLPAGVTYYNPKIPPDPNYASPAQVAYKFWPVKRERSQTDGKFTNDKMRIHASNVSIEFATYLTQIDWYDTPIIIRKFSPLIASPTANDSVVVWSGQIDAVKIIEKELVFECSSDFANLQATAPRENMHTACRFQWGDDLCTVLPYRTENYKTMTAGASSTKTQINSSDLTQDVNNGSSYGTDLVNPLLAAAITASSEGANYTNQPITVTLDRWSQFSLTNHGFSLNDAVQFTATVMPTGLSAGVTYYVRPRSNSKFDVMATPDSNSIIHAGTTGTSVKISTVGSFSASSVRSSITGFWKLGDPTDWGTLTQGFYRIPDAQSGLANAALKPWIQFDFGSAKQPTLWRLQTVADVRLEELVRLVEFFSSPDASTWTHETYFEIPPEGGILYEVQLPKASSARYWRICVRSRWAQSLFYALLNKVYAYESSRHWWQSGRVTFDAATATAALRGVSRKILESYSGKLIVRSLPVAPAAGDTFVIQRGCPRTFNACCARENWENFGGFLDLPYQTVIR